MCPLLPKKTVPADTYFFEKICEKLMVNDCKSNKDLL